MNVREYTYLWRCAAFGVDPTELNQSLRRGYEATVDALFEERSESVHEPFTTVLPPTITGAYLEIAGLVTWWVQRMGLTTNPLREKMTLFWHGFFTTSADPVVSAGLLFRQNQLFREHAVGRFEDLLASVADDTAMLFYLDGIRNRYFMPKQGANPNENFAREVMEMFSVGAGHYSEGDVRAAARAFTGFDDEPKRFLGRTGALTQADVLHDLAHHPATASHLCQRLFEFFTGKTPSVAALRELAEVFTHHHGHMRPVLRALFLSDEFRAGADQPSYLSPIEYLVNLQRILQSPMAQLRDWNLLERLQQMGQMPFLPPSVRGWPHGPAWINTATLRARLELVSDLLQRHRIQVESWIASEQSGRAGVERLLALAQRSDASPETRLTLSEAYCSPADAWRVFSLILQGPEMHLR